MSTKVLRQMSRAHAATEIYTMTDLERARHFMRDILRQPDCCDAELVVLAERFEKAVSLLMNVNDLFCEHPLPANETIAEEVREFFGLPV